MSVFNGQAVNAEITNAAFMSRLIDSSAIGKIRLENPNSGAIDDVQKYINKIATVEGIAGENDNNATQYSSTSVISNGDSRKVAIGKLDLGISLVDADLQAFKAIANATFDDHLAQLNALDARLTQCETDNAGQDARLLALELGSADHETRIDTLEANNTQDVTLAPVGSVPNDNGASLTGQTLTLQPASATKPGVLTAGSQTIGGDKTFQGNVVVTGDFEVQGTRTYLNTQDLDVEDANVKVNVGGTNGSAEGAGFTVNRPAGDAGLLFDSSLTSKFKLGLIGATYEVLVSGIAQVVSGIKDFVSGIKTDTIAESTNAAGVTIDGVLVKDGNVDGRDVSVDGAALDSHVANMSNPHGTTAAQVGADPAGTASASMAAHLAASDPHPQYLTPAEGNAAYDALGAAAGVQSNLTTHVNDLANPHAVTKAQVGLANVTNDSQLKRAAGDLNTFTQKNTLDAADVLLIEDSSDSYNKKKVLFSALSGGGGGAQSHIFHANGVYNKQTVPMNAVDGLWRVPYAIKLTNIFLIQEVAGSSGTTTAQVQYKAPAGSWTSVCTTNPSLASSAGAEVSVGVGEVVPNATAPVLTASPVLIPAGSLVRMNITAVQAGDPNNLAVEIVFEPQ